MALERGGRVYPYIQKFLYTHMAAISSNTQWGHLSLLLPYFASDPIRSFPAYFDRVCLPPRHTVEHDVLRDALLLMWL